MSGRLRVFVATPKVTPGRILTCNRAHSWQLHGDQTCIIITWVATDSYHPDIELTSYYPMLVMPNVRLGSNTFQFRKSLVCLNQIAISEPSTQEICVHTYLVPAPGSTHRRKVHRLEGTHLNIQGPYCVTQLSAWVGINIVNGR